MFLTKKVEFDFYKLNNDNITVSFNNRSITIKGKFNLLKVKFNHDICIMSLIILKTIYLVEKMMIFMRNYIIP